MDEMRATLDSLMGKNRNDNLDERKKKRQSFRDPDVCKYHLVDFCPHELFPNTRSDLGPCGKIHSDAMKEAFQNDKDYDHYLAIYEDEFMEFLQRLVKGVEQKIKRGNERIVAPLPENQVSEDKQQRIDHLNMRMSSLIKEAEEVAETGNIKEAEAMQRQINSLRREVEKLSSTPYDTYVHKEKQLRVCSICGAMQSLGDSMSRFESHISGKQHQGYERVRAALEQIKQKKEERAEKKKKRKLQRIKREYKHQES